MTRNTKSATQFLRGMCQQMMRVDIAEWLRERIHPRLYSHSTATQEFAGKLADIYGVDRQKAMLAGLLHDRAKGMSYPELLSHAELYHIQLDSVRLAQPGSPANEEGGGAPLPGLGGGVGDGRMRCTMVDFPPRLAAPWARREEDHR